ncbi:hypothetical protein [Marinobacter halodurans]|uniref:hypothetical protein n=1 Tax=Marinobacter halodurans TaxID=2528979 RepID=UPI001A9556F3|nr:hypothetical protein [Marinobacter halodurans]
MNSDTVTIHTLGPAGTNCEKAGYFWLENKGLKGDVKLYDTLEIAITEVKKKPNDVLLGCAVYPELHHLVFENLKDMEIQDSFIIPTYNMVLAASSPDLAFDASTVIATHPAPAHLAKKYGHSVKIVNSNSQAAWSCVHNEADACITTLKAAMENDLTVVCDFGEVPMCFTIHANK